MVIKVKYNGEWVKIPYLSDVHGEELVTEAPKDDKQYARQNGVWTVVNIPEVDFTDIYTALDTKVDKVEGKGLSTEDYLYYGLPVTHRTSAIPLTRVMTRRVMSVV